MRARRAHDKTHLYKALASWVMHPSLCSLDAAPAPPSFSCDLAACDDSRSPLPSPTDELRDHLCLVQRTTCAVLRHPQLEAKAMESMAATWQHAHSVALLEVVQADRTGVTDPVARRRRREACKCSSVQDRRAGVPATSSGAPPAAIAGTRRRSTHRRDPTWARCRILRRPRAIEPLQQLEVLRRQLARLEGQDLRCVQPLARPLARATRSRGRAHGLPPRQRRAVPRARRACRCRRSACCCEGAPAAQRLDWGGTRPVPPCRRAAATALGPRIQTLGRAEHGG